MRGVRQGSRLSIAAEPGAATPVATEGGTIASEPQGWRSWRQAHSEAKEYEAKLSSVIANATKMVAKLETLFLDNVTITSSWYASEPQENREVNRTVAEDFGMGELLALPQLELAVPDVEKTPPLLAGEWATGKAIVGRFSTEPCLQLPDQAYPAQFQVGSQDDPEASDEENKLWQEALGLVIESLDSRYLEAEQSVASVVTAEGRAERRRGPVVEAFRKRVIQQMIYATDGIHKPDQLSEWLEILQTDKRMLRSLALLERSALQAEELQAIIRTRQKEVSEAPEGSQQRERLNRAIREAFDKTRGLDVRIRSCVRAAMDGPETLDAYKKLGEAWDNMNPFKGWR